MFKAMIDSASSAMHNYGFTSTVEKRIHRKGGDFLEYRFMLRYQYFTTVLMALPMLIFLTLYLWRKDFPLINEFFHTIYDIEHLGQLIPKAFMVFLIGLSVSVIIHILLGVRHSIKYKIGKLFFDFFLAGWKAGVSLGVIWAFMFFITKR
ncbi:hypothetical protein ACEV76_05275 [Vibrio parahaemolyticus]